MKPIIEAEKEFDTGFIPKDRGVPDEAREYRKRSKSYGHPEYRGPLPGEQRECKACGRMLVFARTKDAKVMPITLDVKVGGNILVFADSQGVLECRTFSEGPVLEGLREQAIGLRVSHFADCPRADEFRKQRRRTAPQ